MLPFPALLLCAPVGAAFDPSRLDPATLVSLTSDGPLVVLDEGPGPDLATAVTWIGAPPATVLAILADFGSYPTWMPQVREAAPLAGPGPEIQVAIDVAFDFVIELDVEYTLAYRDEGNGRWSYRQVEGDFAVNEGFWEVRPHAGGSLLFYASRVDWSSMRLLAALLRHQPSLELGLGASSVAVIAKAVKLRAERR